MSAEAIAATATEATRTFVPETYLDVNMTDLIEYDQPEDVPEWKWVQDKARWAHKGNGEEVGVWEFMVSVSTVEHEKASIPPLLQPIFQQAEENGCIWIMFHQG